jgi:hypothetical protein
MFDTTTVLVVLVGLSTVLMLAGGLAFTVYEMRKVGNQSSKRN